MTLSCELDNQLRASGDAAFASGGLAVEAWFKLGVS